MRRSNFPGGTWAAKTWRASVGNSDCKLTLADGMRLRQCLLADGSRGQRLERPIDELAVLEICFTSMSLTQEIILLERI